jgi:fructokinase
MTERLGSVEAGGTETVCLIGAGPDAIADRLDLPTGDDPRATLGRIASFFANRVDAVGLGWFGPIDLDPLSGGFGVVGRTPKPGWEGADIVGPLRSLGVPFGLDTDVGAAALGESRWGAGRDVGVLVYLTVGTGIGGAAVVDGSVVHGLGHPEMGHIVVPRLPGDDFPGVCPFHGDCLEGLASGPAVAGRWGEPGEGLSERDAADAAELVAGYVAEVIRVVTYTIAPNRIVVGGGVTRLAGFHDRLRRLTIAGLAGYPGLPAHSGDTYVVGPALGDLSGPLGGLVLADRALV